MVLFYFLMPQPRKLTNIQKSRNYSLKQFINFLNSIETLKKLVCVFLQKKND